MARDWRWVTRDKKGWVTINIWLSAVEPHYVDDWQNFAQRTSKAFSAGCRDRDLASRSTFRLTSIEHEVRS